MFAPDLISPVESIDIMTDPLYSITNFPFNSETEKSVVDKEVAESALDALAALEEFVKKLESFVS